MFEVVRNNKSLLPLVSCIDNAYEALFITSSLIIVMDDVDKENLRNILTHKAYPIGTRLTVESLQHLESSETQIDNTIDLLIIEKVIVQYYGFSVLSKFTSGYNSKHDRIILVI